MTASAWIVGLVLLTASVALGSVQPYRTDSDSAAPATDLVKRVEVEERYGQLPLFFVENRGQAGPDAAYYLQSPDASVYFASTGVAFALGDASSGKTHEDDAHDLDALDLDALNPTYEGARELLALDFVGANPSVMPVGEEPTPAVFSDFSGPPEAWRTGLRTYARLVYPDLWPGIDLVYASTADALKYSFMVQPGVDPSQIRLAYRGAMSLRVTDAGELEVSTAAGGLVDGKPYSYQAVGGRQLKVATSYDVSGSSYGFRVGTYDRGAPLVIDPAFLYAGYLGSAGDDRGLGIAVDSTGAAYICGRTPTAALSYQAFIAKVNAAGTAFSYIATLGGSGVEECFDVVVDGAGQTYMTGVTWSDETTFPAFVGPDLTFNGGRADAFLAKVNAAGTALIFAGYIGGDEFDFTEGVALDSSGNIYLEGPTESTEATFPDGDGFGALPGFDQTQNGRWDKFVVKVNAAGTGFVYGGFIGGSGHDVGLVGRFVTDGHIAVDAAENAYVSGMTKSDETTFPDGDGFGSLASWDTTHAGGYDAFVAKVNAAGTALVYAGYIGGRSEDMGFGMQVDAAGNAYLTGRTKSNENTFPVVGGPDLTHNGGLDSFVAKVNAAGTGLVYCGYLGGDNLDQGHGVALDASGSLYVIGHTHSSGGTFPVVSGPDLTYNGAKNHGDGYVGKLKANPTNPVPSNNYDYLGYVGGDQEDSVFWVALDTAGNAYIVGDTDSTQATFPDGNGFGSVPGPYQLHNGGTDAFVAKVG